jgi:DNA mismatch repair protein MSH3
VSSTKAVVRYHTPTIFACVERLSASREKLFLEARAAWNRLLLQFVERHFDTCSRAAAAIAEFDVLLSLAFCSKQSGWVRPTVFEEQAEGERVLEISGGRNPIVEKLSAEEYVPNDTTLRAPSAPSTAPGNQRALVITGPNMGGKSSFVRQVALCVCLAQLGCFVPASEMTLTACDAVFTRMGSEDAIQSGQSTFFVELQQTSVILRRATRRSLVILDELGRGTSTVDGCAIADATLRFLLTDTGCFTLFVTHYAGLSRVCDALPHLVRDAHMSFLTASDLGLAPDPSEEHRITFLYTLVDGPAKSSYGLNVAALAGLRPALLAVAGARSRALDEGFDGNTKLARLVQIVQDGVMLCQEDEEEADDALQELKSRIAEE